MSCIVGACGDCLLFGMGGTFLKFRTWLFELLLILLASCVVGQTFNAFVVWHMLVLVTAMLSYKGLNIHTICKHASHCYHQWCFFCVVFNLFSGARKESQPQKVSSLSTPSRKVSGSYRPPDLELKPLVSYGEHQSTETTPASVVTPLSHTRVPGTPV